VKLLFGIFFWRATFWDFVKASRREWLAREGTPFGGALGVAGQGRWSTLELHMALPFALFFLLEGKSGGILVFFNTIFTPWLSYK
jgi:hypothetical protein